MLRRTITEGYLRVTRPLAEKEDVDEPDGAEFSEGMYGTGNPLDNENLPKALADLMRGAKLAQAAVKSSGNKRKKTGELFKALWMVVDQAGWIAAWADMDQTERTIRYDVAPEFARAASRYGVKVGR